MRSALLLALLLIAAPAGRPGAAPMQGPPGLDREFTVINHAKQAINELYVSASAAESWGEDRLGEQMLDPGQSLRVKLGRSKDCAFDLQAVYVDASREEVHGIDICRTRLLAFDGSTAVPAPVMAALHDITLINRAPRPIQQVLISSSDAGDWGDDRLTRSSISVGDSATLQFRGDCVADLRVVFDNRSAEERRGIDLCAARRIAIQPGWVTADAVPADQTPGNETTPVNVVNSTGHPINSLFLYPAGSPDRGPDLLGGTPLADKASLGVTLARPDGVCSFAAHAGFGGKPSDLDVAGLDVCRAGKLELRGR
jgi:hypothetical protein